MLRRMNLELGPRQRALVATALTVLALAIIVVATGSILWLTARFLGTFSNVFLPLACGAIGALVCQPYYDWLRRRARLPTALAVTAVILTFALPVVGVLWLFGSVLVDQVSGLLQQLPAFVERARAEIERRLPELVRFFEESPVGQGIREAAESGKEKVLSGLEVVGSKALSAGWSAVRFAGTLLGWVVTPVYFVFFLTMGGIEVRRLERGLPFLKPETREDLVFLVHEFVNILVAFFRGQLVVACAQGLLFAIGFAVVGLSYGFVLGLVLGFLNIIPYLGSLLGLAVALPIALFQPGGGWEKVAAVMVVFGVVQVIEAYVLTPRIMGGRTGLHPVVIIVAVFFWGTALKGILGMILAIPLTAFLVIFWRLLKDKYIDEWV
jgi:predicted PurR-regulated permease PerM